VARGSFGALSLRFCAPAWGYAAGMERPARVRGFQWLGDKRTQVVYDLDAVSDEATIEELMASDQYLVFGPDTLAEARNRGYRHRSI
jgi:hypothetical protein